MTTSLTDCCAPVIEIALTAAAEIMAIYNGPENNWSVEYKDDKSPLTAADSRAHSIIVRALHELTPDIPVVSEEDEVKKNHHPTSWIVDPLDGTKEFLKRNGQFTVNIGYQTGGRPILGVVVAPATGEIWFAAEGGGAYYCQTDLRIGVAHNLFDGATPKPCWQAIRCARFDWGDEGLVVLKSSSHGSEATDRVLRSLKNPRVFGAGSSIKILRVAEGKAHVYPRYVPCCEWDTCAAHAILREAGGRILAVGDDNHVTENEVRYGKTEVLNPFFVCIGDCSAPPPF